MENIDRMKRQEAGRKIIAEAGYTDEKEILAVLGSPTKVLDPQAKEWTPPRLNANAPVFQFGAARAHQQPHFPTHEKSLL